MSMPISGDSGRLSYIELDDRSTFVLMTGICSTEHSSVARRKIGGGTMGAFDQRRASPMIHVTHFKFRMRSEFINRVWLAIAISLFSCAASAETYPVNGVWVANNDHFPGSTAGACFILKKIGIDAVSSQPFPSLMIFSDNKRFDVRGDYRVEKTVRSVETTTDGRFRITESPGKRRWLPLFKKPFFTLKIVDAMTIEVAEGSLSTRFSKCSTSPSL